jgi:hypothetical protein
MDQKEEVRKEQKKRRAVLTLGISFFVIIFLLIGLIGIGTKLTKDLAIAGRVLFTFADRGNYLIVMNNDLISAFELADQLGNNFNVWDKLTKPSGSDIIKILRKDSIAIEVKIDFIKAEEILERKIKYLNKK